MDVDPTLGELLFAALVLLIGAYKSAPIVRKRLSAASPPRV